MSIRDRVINDPACADAYAARDCHELARICSIGRTRNIRVPIADVQAMLQGKGEWWAIKTISGDPQHPAYLAAVTVTDVARARYDGIDTALPIVNQMLSALVSAGAMSQASMDEIMVMGAVPDPYTQREIAVALYNDDGTIK